MSEREGDAFLGGRLRLVQPIRGHRAGLDAVMLAAAARVRPDDAVLDAGAGCGIVGLCIAAREASCRVVGVEIEPGLSALGAANAERNGLARRYQAINADLTRPQSHLAAFDLTPDSFDCVVANPPFHPQGRVTESPEPARTQAAVMPEGGLENWLRFMTAMAKSGGVLALIYPAAALAELLAAMDARCGGIVVFPLFPRLGEPAHRVIVSGIKGSRAPLELRGGMILHGSGNAFTPEAETVLRGGGGIDVGV